MEKGYYCLHNGLRSMEYSWTIINELLHFIK